MAGTMEAQPLKKPLEALHIHRLLIGHIVPVWREMFIAQDNVTLSACKAGALLQRVSVKLLLASATMRKCGSCPVTFILQCGSNTPLITPSTSPCLTTKEIMKTNLIPGSTRLFFLDCHPGNLAGSARFNLVSSKITTMEVRDTRNGCELWSQGPCRTIDQQWMSFWYRALRATNTTDY